MLLVSSRSSWMSPRFLKTCTRNASRSYEQDATAPKDHEPSDDKDQYKNITKSDSSKITADEDSKSESSQTCAHITRSGNAATALSADTADGSTSKKSTKEKVLGTSVANLRAITTRSPCKRLAARNHSVQLVAVIPKEHSSTRTSQYQPTIHTASEKPVPAKYPSSHTRPHPVSNHPIATASSRKLLMMDTPANERYLQARFPTDFGEDTIRTHRQQDVESRKEDVLLLTSSVHNKTHSTLFALPKNC